MLSRRAVLLAAPLAAAFAFEPTTGRTMRQKAALMALSDTPPPVDSAAAAVRNLSADLYHDLARSDSRPVNLVFSPYSIMSALAMARVGARGSTASEMDAVLHAPQPAPGALDVALSSLSKHLVDVCQDPTGNGGKQPQLGVANSLWSQAGLAVEPTFLQTLADYYQAGLNTVDFAHAPETARQQINAWVSKRTSTKIPELIAKGLITPLTALVLANALYLKASWQYPFDPKLTEAGPFTRDDGKTLTVPLMWGAGVELGYLEADDCFAVDLPYVGSQLAMAVVVPTRARLSDWETTLTSDALTALLTGFAKTRLRVRMPKWTFRLPLDLSELLARVGMPTAFSGNADFTGITRETKLQISKVVHETFVSVDEKGTEAAAATAVIIDRAAPPRTITVDRPFLYVIHDVTYGTPLFIGRVGDPTVST